ncbi:hypothetical protein EII34_08980 [Arachnia propionica]|uniref:Carboxypeptidase regulatory-like domain-containing protein n=1 Tax=Arachnia propionica TaxID=1750 RepID=A0A3P1T5T9_9ACTN|nr:hypothetical protein [Arachnia propionica]RRD04668.1 hypothetical protein EII34_08980 [Arachnia propionica]
MLRRGLAGVVLLLVTACTGSPSQSPAPTDATTTSVPEQVAVSSEPDPTTAGSLTEESLPRTWLGFEGTVVEPAEGEFNPNGSWVHGQDPVLISTEAVPRCTLEEPTPLPVPTAALTGTYRNPEGKAGVAIALEFSSPAEAVTWFDGYGAALATCRASEDGLFRITEIDASDTLIVDVRDYHGTIWSERVDVAGPVVRLLSIESAETLDNLRLTL